jgi:Xaa-Pro aminopeptidase
LTELEQRRRAVQTALAGDKSKKPKADALLVSSLANIRYLTGYAGSNGLALVTPSETHFFTDPRYALEASQTITCKLHIAKGPLLEAVAGVVKRKKLKKIGFEPAWLNLEQHQKLKDLLPLGASLQPVPGVIETLRMTKSPAEIDQIRKSVRVNSEAYARTLRRVRLGMRERDIAAELDYQMRLHGGELAIRSRLGEGTRVTVRMPLDCERARREKKLSAPAVSTVAARLPVSAPKTATGAPTSDVLDGEDRASGIDMRVKKSA